MRAWIARVALPCLLCVLCLVAAARAQVVPPTPLPKVPPNTSFQWQIDGGTIDQSYQSLIYDVDLDFTDAATISSLRAAGHIVVCYFSAGTWENFRPDASSFPASVKGKPYEAPYQDELWLNVKNIAVLGPIMTARMQKGIGKGCQGFEFDDVDGFDYETGDNPTGFSLTVDDQLTYDRFLADTAHSLGALAVLKNTSPLAAQLVAWFDFSLTEQCYQYSFCDLLLPFINAGKAVFDVEYEKKYYPAVCTANGPKGIDSQLKKTALDGSRTMCKTYTDFPPKATATGGAATTTTAVAPGTTTRTSTRTSTVTSTRTTSYTRSTSTATPTPPPPTTSSSTRTQTTGTTTQTQTTGTTTQTQTTGTTTQTQTTGTTTQTQTTGTTTQTQTTGTTTQTQTTGTTTQTQTTGTTSQTATSSETTTDTSTTTAVPPPPPPPTSSTETWTETTATTTQTTAVPPPTTTSTTTQTAAVPPPPPTTSSTTTQTTAVPPPPPTTSSTTSQTTAVPPPPPTSSTTTSTKTTAPPPPTTSSTKTSTKTTSLTTKGTTSKTNTVTKTTSTLTTTRVTTKTNTVTKTTSSRTTSKKTTTAPPPAGSPCGNAAFCVDTSTLPTVVSPAAGTYQVTVRVWTATAKDMLVELHQSSGSKPIVSNYAYNAIAASTTGSYTTYTFAVTWNALSGPPYNWFVWMTPPGAGWDGQLWNKEVPVTLGSGGGSTLVPPPPPTTPPPPPPPSGIPISTDSSCGSGVYKYCPASQCCSQYGWCGTTTDYCGAGCQRGFGNCA